MHSLTANDILHIWEIGQNQHPLDRALTMLAVAMPDQATDELAQMTIGQRDRWLLRLRQITLGEQLVSVVQCPKCGEQLELAMDVRDFQATDPALTIAPALTLQLAEFAVQIHLPNSYDLAAVVGSADLATAYQRLLQRCILPIDRAGEPIRLDELPTAILTQLSEHLAAIDPQAEIILTPICPACEHSWPILFDIVTFFWTELSGQARRLMQEVYQLARLYGWREADILAMSPMRRQFYLDLVT
jgi:hypothetical protein